jgi:hypothetical protein
MGQNEDSGKDSKGTRLSLEMGGVLLIQFQRIEDRFKVSFVGMEASFTRQPGHRSFYPSG